MASDFSKFFRSVSSVPQPQREDVDLSTTEVPPSDKVVVSTRKKITRIPLFGRSRKLSTASSSSNLGNTSTDAGRPSTSEPARHPSLLSLSIPIASSSKNTTSSFSKFAAHFSPSQSKPNLGLDSLTSSSRTSLTSAPSVSSLMPPNARPSYDSGSSNATKTRSTTPRGVHPVIMVSDNLDEFKDLFTQELPTQKFVSKSLGKKQDVDTTKDLSEPATFRRGQTPASALAAAVRDQASSNSTDTSTDSGKSSNDGKTTPKLSDVRDKVEGPARRPSTSTGVEGSSSVRSRMRPPSAGSRTKPPSMPLPDVPTDNAGFLKVDAALPVITDGRTHNPESNRSTVRQRPRTSTISSLTSSSSISTFSNREQRASRIVDPLNVSDIEDIDIDTAMPEQLRRALRSRNRKFQELTSYMLRKEEAWEVERKSFEKKISMLQRDLGRRESEITGLKLIINEERRPGKPSQAALSDQEGFSSSGSRRVHYQSDSGAESRGGSGNDSSSSVLGHRLLKKMHHRSSAIAIGSSGNATASRSGPSIMRLPRFSTQQQPQQQASSQQGNPSLELAPLRRMSLLSISSSGSSSGTSSLLTVPPAASPSVTMSSLSAIPEGSSGERASRSSSIQQQQRASRRISASSLTSSSSVYSTMTTNIKRPSRPPSIAQVLDKSSSPTNLEEVLEQLRPFAA